MLKMMKSGYFKNGEPIKVKRGCYTMKNIEKVSLGKVKYDSLTGKSVIDPTISQLGHYMKKIIGINNGNYIDMLPSKKIFSFEINKLSTTDNVFNGKPCDVLYNCILATLIKTSFGDIIYFEPKNIQYKKLVNGVIDQLKISLIDGDGSEISSNFKISIIFSINFKISIIPHIHMEVGDRLNPQRSYRKGLLSRAYDNIS